MEKPTVRISHMSWTSRRRPRSKILPMFMGPTDVGSEIFRRCRTNFCASPELFIQSFSLDFCPEIFVWKFWLEIFVRRCLSEGFCPEISVRRLLSEDACLEVFVWRFFVELL